MSAQHHAPSLIAVGGWIATGKSTLARGVAEALGAELLVADRTRIELQERWDERDGHTLALQHNLSPDAADEIYGEMIHRAEPLLRAGHDVVLDGCFASRRQRAWAQAVAQRCGAHFHLLLCRAATDVIEARLEERARAAGLPLRAWKDLLEALLARWEPPTELAPTELSLIPTDETSSKSLTLALASLKEALSETEARQHPAPAQTQGTS